MLKAGIPGSHLWVVVERRPRSGVWRQRTSIRRNRDVVPAWRLATGLLGPPSAASGASVDARPTRAIHYPSSIVSELLKKGMPAHVTLAR